MAAQSGVGLAMKFFGKKNVDGKEQTLSDFRDEWKGIGAYAEPGKGLTDQDRAELTAGLADDSLTY